MVVSPTPQVPNHYATTPHWPVAYTVICYSTSYSLILDTITSSANLTPVLGCRRRYSAVRGSLLRSSDGRLAGRDRCLRRCPIGGDDDGLASTVTGENDDHAASGGDSEDDDDDDTDSVANWWLWAAVVAVGISGPGPTSSYCTLLIKRTVLIFNDNETDNEICLTLSLCTHQLQYFIVFYFLYYIPFHNYIYLMTI